MTWGVFILICSAALPPKDCTRATAADVIALPGASCSIDPFAVLAQIAIRPRADQYPRVVCESR